MRVAFIVNPKAGRGKAKRIWDELNKEHMIEYPDSDVFFTEYPGHAQVIAHGLSENEYQCIVSVGGDGTVHEIVNGIMQRNIALGIIPAGSGNDLARTLKISQDYREAFNHLRTGRIRTIDLGLAGDRYFINIGGVGFDAEVVAEMNNRMKYLRGTTAYVVAVLKKLITFVPITLKISIDEIVIEGKVYICAIANGKYYGGGMMLAPNAVINDGLFDICVLEDLSKLDFLKTFPQVFKGTHIDHPKVKIYRGKHIRIEGPPHLSIHADGEVFGKLPAEFRIIPNGMRVLGL